MGKGARRSTGTRTVPYGEVKRARAICHCFLCRGPNEGRTTLKKRARQAAKRAIEKELLDADL